MQSDISGSSQANRGDTHKTGSVGNISGIFPHGVMHIPCQLYEPAEIVACSCTQMSSALEL